MPRTQQLRIFSALAGCAALLAAIVIVTFITGTVPHDLVAVLSALTGWLIRDVFPPDRFHPYPPRPATAPAGAQPKEFLP